MALNLDYDHAWKPDAPTSAGPDFDFDPNWKPAPEPKGGLVAAAKQAIGGTIKGAGQAAADFLPGVDQDNALKRYGQGVVDANPTAVSSLADLKDKPLTGIAEATGNAGGSMSAMLGARALGMGITAASPLAGPAAPLIAGLGQAVSWAGPAAAAALPSFGGIREKQIRDDPTRQDSVGSKLLAAVGAGTVGLIESKFGPQEWALKAMSKEGREALAEKFVAKSLTGSIAKGAEKGAAIESAEELAQNPIEQLASYQNPLTAENLKDTAFSVVMGGLGGGVLGGASGAAFRGNPEKPGQNPAATPGDQSIPYTPTTVEEVAKARAEAMGIKPENGPLSVASGMAIEAQTAEEMRLSTPGILAQGAAAAEQARLEQEARQAAEPGIPYEPVAVEAPQAAPTTPTVPVIDPQIPTQDWINRQTGVDQSSGVTRRDFEVAAKEQADPQIILDESGRPKTTTSALEIQQFHADFDRRKALRQRKLSAAERLRAARRRKNIVEAAQPDEVAQPAAPVVVDVAQPAITEDPPALGFTPQKPEPMRATADGQVGTPQQFDDLARTKATRKDQMRRAEDRVREMVQAGARMRGRDLVAPSGAVVMPNLTLLQAAKARQFTREAPNAQQDQSQPAPAQAVQAEAQGSQQQPAPESDAGNGFKHGPQAGERYRVGQVSSVGGAIALEKRLPAGTNATFYVGVDGILIDGDSLNLISNESRSRLWIPANSEQASQALHVLDEMGRLALSDPRRAEMKRQLKSLVTNSAQPTQVPGESDPREAYANQKAEAYIAQRGGNAPPKAVEVVRIGARKEFDKAQGAETSNEEPTVEAIDVSTRTDDQLRYLASNGKPGWKEAAQAEMARREGAKPAEPDSGLPDSRAGGSGERVAEPVSAPYKLPLNLRDKNAALVEMASLTGKSDKEVRESFSAMWKREGRESAEKRLVATVERWRAEKSPEAKQSQSPTTSGNSAKKQGSQQQPAVAPAQDLSSEAPLARPNIKESRNGTDNSLPNAEVAQKAPEGGGVVIRGGGNAVDARAGARAEPKGRVPPESNPGVGQGALDANGEVAEQPNPAEPDSGLPDSRAGGSGERVAKQPKPTNLLRIVREAGGVSATRKNDVAQDSRAVGVFRSGGMELDSLAELLHQNGYLTDADISDPASGSEKAVELLREAIAGNRPLNLADNERAMSDAQEAEYRDSVRKRADELGVKWRFRKIEDVERDVQARENEVAPEDMSAYAYTDDGALAESRDRLYDIDLDDMPALSEEGQMRAMGFTEEEINEAISRAGDGEVQGQPEQAQSGAAQANSRRSTQENPGAQSSILESYSEQDLAARDEAQRLKAEENARKDKAAEDKARADSERDSFTLTGSDRSADTAAAQGQGDIFDQPAKNAQPTQINGQQETRNNLIARLDAAEDFSEEQSNLIDKLYEVTLSEVSAMHWRGDMPIFETGRNTFMTISPSTQQPGKTQVTLYSNRGISGDTQYDSVEAAVRGEHLFGNRILSPADAEDRFAESLNAEAEYQANVSRQRMAPDRPAQNQNPIKTETRANTGPEAEVASANKETRMTSQEWRDKGKSPVDLIEEKADYLGRQLAMTIAEEASQKDFAPNELATAVRMWADDGKVPADSLRIATLKHVSDFGLSDGRIKQIRAALNPLNAKNQEPTKLSVDLESLFADLDSSTVRKANKAKKAAKAHPLADKIQNVQDNFLDILQELEDSGKVKINC